MSKLDIGVGDDFPLDEDGPLNEAGPLDQGREDGRHHGRHRHHRHGHHHGRHRHHPMHGHHRGRGFGGLAFLLVGAGILALIVEHQLTAPIAYGMIGGGVALLALRVLVRAVFHWRRHRSMTRQAL